MSIGNKRRIMGHTGNSLLEYGLVGAVVLMSALVILWATSGQLNQWLSGLKDDLARNTRAAELASNRTGGGGNPNGPPGEPVPPPEAGEVQICFESGYCVNIPIVENGQVQVAASNGADMVHSFSDVLDQIVAQLQAKGVDPQTVRMVSELARSGHNIADSHSAVYELCQQVTCSKAYFDANPDAKTLSETANNNRLTLINRYSELDNFLKTNPEALPPELQQVIALQYTQIHSMARNAIKFNNPVLVEQNSNTICNSGGTRCTRTKYGSGK